MTTLYATLDPSAVKAETHVGTVGGRMVTRTIPQGAWLSMACVAVTLSALLVTAWEATVRHWGYQPSLDDTTSLWASQRERAMGATREQVVFVGSSRTLFDMDIDAFHKQVPGPRPIQLATVGSNPAIVLADLARDESFAGTAIVDVVAGLLAAAAGPPVATPKRYVSAYHQRAAVDALEMPLFKAVDERLALLQQDELTLNALIDRAFPLPLRPFVYAPKMPGFMYTLDESRQAKMLDGVANNEARAVEIQQVWLTLFQGPPKPAVFTAEQWSQMMNDGWESNVLSVKDSVAKIQARGGRVIFSRLPSTSHLFSLEEKLTPRSVFWERVLRETGAPGIHFSDYPELRDFSCPEWSHLSAADATLYTQQFATILKREKLL